MAKKPVKSQGTVEGNGQFINYTFNEVEQKTFKAYRDGLEISEFNERIEGLLDKRYNLSVKWDTFNECYSCFIIEPKGDDGAQSHILTGRGRSAVSAIAGALFRHYDVFQGVWPLEAVRKRGTDDD